MTIELARERIRPSPFLSRRSRPEVFPPPPGGDVHAVEKENDSSTITARIPRPIRMRPRSDMGRPQANFYAFTSIALASRRRSAGTARLCEDADGHRDTIGTLPDTVQIS